jgi:hypothetical protein
MGNLKRGWQLDNKEAQMFKRLYDQEFVDYLRELSEQNYRGFKHDGFELGEMHRGYAICVDSLLDKFAECNQFLEKSRAKHVINEI